MPGFIENGSPETQFLNKGTSLVPDHLKNIETDTLPETQPTLGLELEPDAPPPKPTPSRPKTIFESPGFRYEIIDGKRTLIIDEK